MTCPFCGSPVGFIQMNVYDVKLPGMVEADASCSICEAYRRAADGQWVLISDRAPGVKPEA